MIWFFFFPDSFERYNGTEPGEKCLRIVHQILTRRGFTRSTKTCRYDGFPK